MKSNFSQTIFADPSVSYDLTDTYKKHGIAPADKTSSNFFCVYKANYIDCLINEPGMNDST